MSKAAELLQQSDPVAALKALTEEVRAKPADSKLRVFMAQLLCVLGQWERALNQLSVAAELDALAVPMKQMYGEAIRCESLRGEVFAGKRTPMIFGQPEPWLALLVESLLRHGAGEPQAAEQLRARAFDEAPATSGHIDGAPFEWLADADMRLGPVLEAYINGRYYWVPFSRLSQVKMEAPEDLRDAVWMPAHLQFANGGEALALIPTRYEGTLASGDGALLLARKTEWEEAAPEVWTGLGQRVFSSDQGEHALMDVREIAFDSQPAAEAGPGSEPAADGAGDGAHG
ncbi:type VI secretion system accessory protein TagJ [Xenophilus arseniciresistens]|uniref:Type VI secretion system accessory protein TagJ n=1 Tax=Xenophilus arseniciresistens TaxID=1283306 RepID=A0AAE3T1M9_9BURK|nr:type VI secretion system accessory protein TagJ [Xenophilus arseniciresistens]MDA7418760.1 type VI secretion system accessory protein TagJ [Xenophilus arseniciresistens]